jgi:hypothetical protein
MSNLGLTAFKLIEKNGQTATHVSVAEGAYDPATGVPALTETTKAIKVYVDASAFNRDVNVQKRKAVIYAAAISFAAEPRIEDRIVVGADAWIVESVSAYNLAGANVLFMLPSRLA